MIARIVTHLSLVHHLPAPVAIVAPARAHSRTIDFAYGAIAEYDAAFGFSNWRIAAPYLDLVVTSPGLFDQKIRAGGIATSGYVDVSFCSGHFASGANEYASPDCAALPPAAFYVQDGTGDPLTTSYNDRVLDLLGNPQSPELRGAALARTRAELSGGDLDTIEIDDAHAPAELGYTVCAGIGSFSAGHYSCARSPGGAASAGAKSPGLRAPWVAGMTELARALPRPAILNGLWASDSAMGPSAALDVILATPGSWGGFCDTCFYSNNAYAASGKILDAQLQNVMTVTAAGKNVGVINDAVTDPARRERGLAETMLFYDADHTWTSGGPCGGRSMIHACPEQALVFTEPLLPYPASPAAVRRTGGTYVREFGACFASGRAAGPCAAVVNPDPREARAWPALSGRYAHTLVIEGDSLCACFGTRGSIAEDGPAPPAMLPPAAGMVVFR